MDSSNRPLQLQAARQPPVHQFVVTRKRFLVCCRYHEFCFRLKFLRFYSDIVASRSRSESVHTHKDSWSTQRFSCFCLNLFFALDAQKGKIVKDKIRFGAPWKHPPRKDDPFLHSEWEKLQLMDFIQSLVSAEFGINYFVDCSLEIFDDPCVNAIIERFENLKKWKDPGTFTEQDIDDRILKQQQEEEKKRQRRERKKEKKLCPTNGYSRWIMCITQLGQVPYLSFRFNKLFKASGYQVSTIANGNCIITYTLWKNNGMDKSQTTKC
uniref:Uncharacterized protein n=1 Tax=Lactuca sativa TaxID=4236 RepID=A0A9R1V0W6_LACSA|nr:hypothetical protein LSAT_V11C700370010 [Lactuca sativa]